MVGHHAVSVQCKHRQELVRDMRIIKHAHIWLCIGSVTSWKRTCNMQNTIVWVLGSRERADYQLMLNEEQ